MGTIIDRLGAANTLYVGCLRRCFRSCSWDNTIGVSSKSVECATPARNDEMAYLKMEFYYEISFSFMANRPWTAAI